jgi:predicted nucleic acid-binding Zn ribbon protein
MEFQGEKMDRQSSSRKRRSRRQRKRQQRIILAIIAAILLLILIFLIPWLGKMRQVINPAPQFEVVTDCQLGTDTCVARYEHQLVALTVDKVPMSATPMVFTTRLEGFEAESVVLDFQGKEMFMGINQTDMHQIEPGVWSIQTELPVCTTGRMVWHATVLIHEADRDYPIKAIFEFEAH